MQAYAHKNGFVRQNVSKRAKKLGRKEKRRSAEKNLSPYDGHDTVCMIALDKESDMAAASTSGLFMKKKSE